MMEKKGAVILLSGGLDSATAGAIARKQGYAIYALTLSYGQTHAIETRAANEVARFLGAEKHLTLYLELPKIGGSALLGTTPVPKGRDLKTISSEIPSTYVPARNTIFLSYALAWAEVLHVFDIFIGVNAIDFSGYPDCRPEYIAAYERMANLATKMTVEGQQRLKIYAPLIRMTKGEIIRTGLSLGLDYGSTWSCYSPDQQGRPCRHCDSCTLRAKGFKEAGVPDPLLSRLEMP
jgi:7-cyano-7-deazaguanine synthase